MPRKKRVQTSDALTGAVAPAVKPSPVANPADLLERFKDYPAIDVISRRFNDPNDPGSLPILLKDEQANACVNTDHQHKMKPGAEVCDARLPSGVKCGKPARVWYVRWINTAWEGRWAQIKAKGYVPVEITELKDEQDVADLIKLKTDGKTYVRRGDNGKEILCKMPLELFHYVKRQQRDARNARNNSKRAMVEDLSEAAGAELGDEAGQTIHAGGIRVESMRRSHSTLADEAQDDDTIDV